MAAHMGGAVGIHGHGVPSKGGDDLIHNRIIQQISGQGQIGSIL